MAAINCAVILTETVRTQDPELRQLLTALRTGVLDAPAQRLIASRTFTRGESGGLPPNACHISSRNRSVNDIAQSASALLAAAAGQPCVRLMCRALAKGKAELPAASQAEADTYNAASSHPNYIAYGAENGGLTAVCDLFIGQPVNVRAGNSLLRTAGFGNNTETTVVGFADASGAFVRHDDPTHRKLVTLRNGSEVHVQLLPGVEYVIVRASTLKPFRFKGLPPMCLAIKRAVLPVAGTNFKLAQFPLRPSAALTDFGAQGRSIPQGVSVDCDFGKRKAYVAISRATSLAKVVFTAVVNFDQARRACQPNLELTWLMSVLGTLDTTTRAAVQAAAGSAAAARLPAAAAAAAVPLPGGNNTDAHEVSSSTDERDGESDDSSGSDDSDWDENGETLVGGLDPLTALDIEQAREMFVTKRKWADHGYQTAIVRQLGSLLIRKADLAQFAPGRLLNDMCINAALLLVSARSAADKTLPTVKVMGTFLYAQLLQGEPLPRCDCFALLSPRLVAAQRATSLIMPRQTPPLSL